MITPDPKSSGAACWNFLAAWRYADQKLGGDFGVEYKADDSPLTKADKASNAIIVKALRDRFPDYAILSEEEKDNRARLENDLCFVVDPLDGTKEFVKRNGQFTVNIALSCKHRAVMGVIYVPVTGELYYASEGDGAYLEKPDGSVERLRVSTNTDHSKLRAVASGSHGAEEMERLIEKYQMLMGMYEKQEPAIQVISNCAAPAPDKDYTEEYLRGWQMYNMLQLIGDGDLARQYVQDPGHFPRPALDEQADAA